MTYSINTEESQALRQWLKRARKSRKVSMRALGEKLNQPHSFVQKVESGERRLDVVEFVWYCRALDVDAHAGLDQILVSKTRSNI